MEHLENAFHTPAKINMRCGFSDSFGVPLPPIPPVKKQEDLSTLNIPVPIDTRNVHPTVLPGSDSLTISDSSLAEEAHPLNFSLTQAQPQDSASRTFPFPVTTV